MNPVWYLLADFTQRDEPAGELAMQQVTAAVRGCAISPSYLERVRMAVAGAVSQARRDSAGGRVSVRVYVSTLSQADEEQSHGWGFFLVEKTGVPDESPILIELFLYSEEGE